ASAAASSGADREEQQEATGVRRIKIAQCPPASQTIEIAGYWFREGVEPGTYTLTEGQDLEEALRNVLELPRETYVGLPGGTALAGFIDGDTVFWHPPINGRSSGPIAETTSVHVGPEKAETAGGPEQADEEIPEDPVEEEALQQADEEVPEGPVEEQGADRGDEDAPEGPVEEQGADQGDEDAPEGPVEEEGWDDLAPETVEQADLKEDDVMEITNEGEAVEEADPVKKAGSQWDEVMAAADGGDEAAAVLRTFVLQKHGARAPTALWTMLKVFGRDGWRDLPIGGLASLTREVPAEVFFNEDPPE
ncbi:unnamed protein product, partial [Symbiodinium sp. CCMP2456]